MLLVIYGLARLRESIIHFWFPRLKDLWEDFVCYLYDFVVVKYHFKRSVSATYFQIVDAAYQTLDGLLLSEKSTFPSVFKPDHNFQVIPYHFLEDYKAPQTGSDGDGPPKIHRARRFHLRQKACEPWINVCTLLCYFQSFHCVFIFSLPIFFSPCLPVQCSWASHRQKTHLAVSRQVRGRRPVITISILNMQICQ